MSSLVRHLVVGPEGHGVVRHALGVAAACGHDVGWFDTVEEVVEVEECAVVHVPWTDRLFGANADEARAQFDRIAGLIDAAGAALSVTLHDVPHDDSPLQQQRRALYRHVACRARGVVVNSELELRLTGRLDSVRSLRMVRLPLEPAGPSRAIALPPHSVGVLGFVYPDRGYDDVLAALPDDATLVSIGAAARGHEDLLESYRVRGGTRWHSTGFVADDDLAGYLAATAVPIAPNRRVTASASINTWLAHGRRPLVPDCAYVRELIRARPGTMIVYDPDDRAALTAALSAACRAPSSTRLPPTIYRGPTPAEIATEYRGHFAACLPAVATAVGRGWIVPDNRWDLVPARPDHARVSVVVPHFDAQRQLDLVLTALRLQNYPRDLVDVCVADDGSPVPPRVDAAGDLAVRVVRQDDRGFRAARARNLGAAAADGEVLVFLDADTVPEPDFLTHLVAPAAACPDVLAVGRRRHADLSALTPAALRRRWPAAAWPEPLPEPHWLADGYRRSADLLHADRRSYRYVISAVLALSRRLFDEIGGFDERFVGYGGEDWELAHRAWNAGAVFAHVPTAVAWHDGPDWSLRGDPATRAADAGRQARRISALIPDPSHRRPGVPWRYPSVVVHVDVMNDDDAARVVSSAIGAGADCGFWFVDVTGPGRDAVLATDGVRLGTPPQDVLDRAWCQAWLAHPRDLAQLMAWAERAVRHGQVELDSVVLRSTRSVRRRARWNVEERVRDGLFGRHDVA